MTTVEDRLRDALRERAAHCPIDPDAWPQTVARTRRAHRAHRRARRRARAADFGRTPCGLISLR